MKKLATVLFAAALILGLAAYAQAETKVQYQDVNETNWAYEAISAMSQKGILTGYPDQTFKPQNTVTYGEFIKMTVLAATGSDAGNAQGQNWAKGYYDAAIQNGYFTTHDISEGSLGQEMPRGEMALILSSVLGDVEIQDYEALSSKIIDVNAKTRHEYHIIKTFSQGVLTGYPDKTFRPKGTLTRAEAATVVDKLIKVKEGAAVPANKAADQKSTKERMMEGESSEFVNWSESSASKLLVEDIISNKSELPALQYVQYYEIVEDYPYQFSFERNLVGTEDLNVGSKDYARGGVLIKDEKAIQLESVQPYYYLSDLAEGSAFPKDFDYIGFYNIGLETMMLVPSPFQ